MRKSKRIMDFVALVMDSYRLIPLAIGRPLRILCRLAGLGSASLLVVSMLSPAANATYETYNDHVMNGGTSSRQFWLSPSAAQFQSGINSAITSWNGTSTAFYFTETSSQGPAEIEFFNTDVNDGNCAVTTQHVAGDPIILGSSNWNYARIKTRPIFTVEDRCGPSGHRKGILAHEVGHAVGLDHSTSGPGALMFSGIAGTSVNAPTSVEVNGLDHLY